MKTALYIGGGIVLLIAVVVLLFRPSNEVPLSTLIEEARAGNVVSLEISGDDVEFINDSGVIFTTRKEAEASIYEVMAANGVSLTGVEVSVTEQGASWLGLLLNFLPLLLFGAIIYAALRAARK
jgi:ATP-dependent Zn protease